MIGMRAKLEGFLLACWFVCTAPATAAISSDSVLFYTGNGYVAAGLTENIKSSDGFSFTLSEFNTVSTLEIFVNNFATESNPEKFKSFILWLTAPLGEQLSAGTYLNVGAAPFEFPGLNFSGNNRGVSFVTGSFFKIQEIGFSGSGVLETLSVDFRQIDEGGFLGQTSGSLRFHSDVAVSSVPEPSTAANLCAGLMALGIVTRIRRQKKRT